MAGGLQSLSVVPTRLCHLQSAEMRNDSQLDNPDDSTEKVMFSVPMARILFVVSSSSIIAATIFGNILVIITVFAEAKLRKVGNFFIVSLAVSDLLVGIFVTPVALVYHLMGEWTFGGVFCDIWIAMDVVCCTASIINLCVISFDRYNAITQPLKYALKRTATRAAFIIAAVWTYAVFIAVPPFIGREKDEQQKNKNCMISQNMIYTVFSTVGAYYIPLVVMVITYVKVFRATLKRKRHWIPLDSQRSYSIIQGKNKDEKSTIRKARVLINVADGTPEGNNSEAETEFEEKHHKGRRKMSVFTSLSLTPGPKVGVTIQVPSSQESLATTPSPDMRETRRYTVSSQEDNSDRELSKKMLSVVSSTESVADISDESAYDCTTARFSKENASPRRTTPSTARYPRSLLHRTPSEKRRLFKKKIASFTSTDTTTTTTTGSDEIVAEAAESRQRLAVVRRTGLHQLQVSSKIAEESTLEDKGDIKDRLKAPISSEHLLQIAENTASALNSRDHSYDETTLAQSLHEKALTIERGRLRQRHRRRKRKNRISLNQERRAAKTLGVIMGCFVVCWLPFFVLAITKPLCRTCEINEIVMTVFTWLGYLNSALNPIIYTFFNQDFRKGFQRILCCSTVRQ